MKKDIEQVEVILLRCRAGVWKIESIKLIRQMAHYDLKKAKHVFDTCLNGTPAILPIT